MPETKRKDEVELHVRPILDPLDEKTALERIAPKDKIKSVKIQLLFPAHVIYAGAVSGKRYDFKEPGSVLEVDSRDVPAMLAYRIGTTGCCGGSDPSGNQVFQTI